ncbi:MAG: hypothetical protein U0L72_10025 [Acutalibacteraceae bacterium]|nr:hypothetical protein [Acutalibacteraceae bacterium]
MGETNVGDVNNMSVQENIHVLEEEILKLSNEKINSSIAEKLNIFYGAKNALENIGVKDLTKTADNDIIQQDGKMLQKSERLFSEYLRNRTLRDLQKLCLEIQEMCVSVYATLQNDEEKQVYIDMVKNIKK